MLEGKRTKQHSGGRPRSEESKNAILNATVNLLEELGYSNLTIEAIASHAGVGKSTIYRWWTNKSYLVFDAFLMSTETHLYFLEEVSLHENFSQHLHYLATILNSTLGRTVVSLVAESGEESEIARAFYLNFLKSRRDDAKQILERSLAQGEIQSTIDLDIVSDMLYAPVYYRILIYKKKVDSEFIHKLVDQVMQGIVIS